MKKPNPQYYARALKAALEEGEEERAEVLSRFCTVLSEDMMLPYTDEILEALRRLYDREEGRVHAHVTSAKELSESEKHIITEYVKEKTDATFVELSEKTDMSLLGGVTLRYENRLLDGSLKHTLKKLSTALKTH